MAGAEEDDGGDDGKTQDSSSSDNSSDEDDEVGWLDYILNCECYSLDITTVTDWEG